MKTTKTKTVSIEPAAGAAKARKPALPSRRLDIAPIQQLIADEIADLLVNGGCADAVDSLLMTAGYHMAWRLAVELCGPGEQQQIDKAVEDRSDDHYDEWKADLMAELKRNRNTAPEARVEPNTATERIHRRVIEELRGRFEGFLTEGTPEEHMILSEVLSTHEGINHGRDSFGELPLGHAMEEALDKHTGDFLRVPHQFEKQVERYIECLRAADCKGVA
jgi:hypothetical protein